MNVTVIRPDGDVVERALSSWAALLLAAVSGGSVSTTDLRGSSATRTAVDSALGSNDASFFFLHGHPASMGDPTTLVDTHNVGKASGTVMVAFSCEAGKTLGPDAVNSSNNVRAFLGFDDLLPVYHASPSLFGREVERAVTPLILSGATVDAVRKDLEKRLKQMEDHYRIGSGKAHPDAAHIWMAAHIAWRGLVVHGNSSATI
jgi:hypothetical protein